HPRSRRTWGASFVKWATYSSPFPSATVIMALTTIMGHLPLMVRCVRPGALRARSHRRARERAAERHEAVRGARDVEVEREVLVDGEHVAQVPLDGLARVDAVGAVARPERLDRLARLVDGEGGMGAEAQLGLEVGHHVVLRRALELERGLAHEIARRVDEASRARDLDLH